MARLFQSPYRTAYVTQQCCRYVYEKSASTSQKIHRSTNCLNLNLNWVTTLRTSRPMPTRRGRVEQLDVELSWVGLLRYKRAYDATQLNSTSSWVELSCCAMNTLYDAASGSVTVADDRRWFWKFQNSATQLTQLNSVHPISAKQVSHVFVFVYCLFCDRNACFPLIFTCWCGCGLNLVLVLYL